MHLLIVPCYAQIQNKKQGDLAHQSNWLVVFLNHFNIYNLENLNYNPWMILFRQIFFINPSNFLNLPTIYRKTKVDMALILFEPETSKLTEYEMNKLLPIMVKALKNKVGKENAITNAYMVEKMREHGYDLTEIRVRKIINYIRTHGLIDCLMASNKGYYISTDKNEMNNYCQSLLGREEAIHEVRMAMESQMERME